MSEYRYILEKGSKKYHCPDCNKKTFVRYIDAGTGDYLPGQYGRCDRESKCGYFLNPYSDGYAKGIWEKEQGNRSGKFIGLKPQRKKKIPKPTPDPVFFDFDTFKQTLQRQRYEQNTFIQNLLRSTQFPFEIEDVTQVVELYRLGTVVKGYRAGAITFPFIDMKGNVRAVQVKQFDGQNHTIGTGFLHSILGRQLKNRGKPLPEWLKAYNAQEKKVSCLFGEHLLSKYPNNPIALVEAPKTAVYGTLYFGLPETPESLIWLAVYNKSSFSFDKLKALQGRFVYVFPDLSKDGSTFNEWEAKAKEYECRLPGTRFIFSDLLEQLAPGKDRDEGSDLADFLIKQDWRKFRKQEQPPKPEPVKSVGSVRSEVPKQKNISHAEPLPKVEAFHPERITKEQTQDWSKEILGLETYFAGIELPNQPIKPNKWSIITDCSLFIETHFAIVKANNGNRTFLPYLNRLQELRNFLN